MAGRSTNHWRKIRHGGGVDRGLLARLLPSRGETVLVARAAGYGDADYSLI